MRSPRVLRWSAWADALQQCIHRYPPAVRRFLVDWLLDFDWTAVRKGRIKHTSRHYMVMFEKKQTDFVFSPLRGETKNKWAFGLLVVLQCLFSKSARRIPTFPKLFFVKFWRKNIPFLSFWTLSRVWSLQRKPGRQTFHFKRTNQRCICGFDKPFVLLVLLLSCGKCNPVWINCCCHSAADLVNIGLAHSHFVWLLFRFFCVLQEHFVAVASWFCHNSQGLIVLWQTTEIGVWLNGWVWVFFLLSSFFKTVPLAMFQASQRHGRNTDIGSRSADMCVQSSYLGYKK